MTRVESRPREPTCSHDSSERNTLAEMVISTQPNGHTSNTQSWRTALVIARWKMCEITAMEGGAHGFLRSEKTLGRAEGAGLGDGRVRRGGRRKWKGATQGAEGGSGT